MVEGPTAMNDWEYFILGVVFFHIAKALWMILNHELHARRQRRFLNLIDVLIPKHGRVTFISVDASDKKSLAALEKELRERFDMDDEEDVRIIRGLTQDVVGRIDSRRQSR